MILHHESFFPRVPLKLHSRHLLHVISIHRLYAALLIMKLHQELAVRFTQENVFTASPAVTHTLCALSDLMHLLLTQGSHLTVPPTAIYSSQATAMTYVLISSHEACSHFPNAQTQLSTFQFLPRTKCFCLTDCWAETDWLTANLPSRCTAEGNRISDKIRATKPGMVSWVFAGVARKGGAVSPCPL